MAHEGSGALDVRVGTSTRERAEQLHRQGVQASRAGRLKEASRAYEACLALARQHGLERLEAQCLANRGTLHCLQGNPQEGVQCLQEARRIQVRLGHGEDEAHVLIQLGTAYRALGAHPEAIGALDEGIQRIENSAQDAVVAGALSALASIYGCVGLHDQAIRHAEEALARFGSNGDPGIHRVLLGTSADAHRGAGDLDRAEALARRMLESARGAGSDAEVVDALETLGRVQWSRGQSEQAEATFREGWATARGLDWLPQTFAIAGGLARVLVARGELAEAQALLAPLLEPWERFGEPGSLIGLYEVRAEIAEGLGDLPTAVSCLRRLDVLRRELFARETDVRLRLSEAARELRRQHVRAEEALRQISHRAVASQEEERRRLALELHDDFGQRLALLAIELDLLARSPPAEAELRRRATRLSDMVRGVADEVHALSHRLHPAILDQLGLAAATQALCEEMAEAFPCAIEFEAQDVPDEVPRESSLCLYRIAQEALGNALRHGKASRVRVHLAHAPPRLTLTVADDGVGFEPQAIEATGLGLVGMQERVRHLDGTFSLRSRPGQGTVVEVSLPPSPGHVGP